MGGTYGAFFAGVVIGIAITILAQGILLSVRDIMHRCDAGHHPGDVAPTRHQPDTLDHGHISTRPVIRRQIK